MNLPRSPLCFALIALWLCVFPLAASAQTCTVSSTGASFGNYDYTNGNSTTGTITLNCTRSLLTNVSVALSAGTFPGATINNRMMAQLAPAGSDHLSYGLYQNATSGPLCAGGVVWGNTPATEPAPIGFLIIGPGFPHSWTVYGCAPSGQDSSVASYGDTVTITITWQ